MTGTVRGASGVVEDATPPEVIELDSFPGNELAVIWATDAPPDVAELEDPTVALSSLAPGPGGTRFLLNRWPPGAGVGEVDPSAYGPEARAKLPGIGERHEAGDTQMHTTDTIDYGIVVAGEIWLELDGEEVHLQTGDCVVQCGARHAWRNRGERDCVMAFVMVGARR